MPRPTKPMADTVDPIARELLAAAEAAGLDKQQIASACGVSYQTVHRWYSGTRDMSTGDAHRLMVALGRRTLRVA